MGHVQHAKTLVGEMTQSMFIDKLLNGLGCVECEGECVSSYLVLNIGVIQRVDSRKLLMRSLNSLNIIFVRYHLEFIILGQFIGRKLPADLHARDGGIVEQIRELIPLGRNEPLSTFVIKGSGQ